MLPETHSPRPHISFCYIKESFLSKLFNQVGLNFLTKWEQNKQNNEGQAAFKEMVSLIEKPGQDLKISLEFITKSITDPA